MKRLFGDPGKTALTSLNKLVVWVIGDGLGRGDLFYRGGYENQWSGGFRTELNLRQQADGYAWTFVGSQNSYGARDGAPAPTGWFGDLPQAASWCDCWTLCNGGSSIEALAAVLETNLPSRAFTGGLQYNLAVLHCGTLDIVHGYANDSGGQPGATDPTYHMEAFAERLVSLATMAHYVGGRCPVAVHTLPPIVNKPAAVAYQNGLILSAVQPYPWIIPVNSGPLVSVSTGLSDNFNPNSSSYKAIGDAGYDAIVTGYAAAVNSTN